MAFRKFVHDWINPITAVLADMNDEQLSMYMHEMKATDMSYGDMSQHSRNALRAAQFNYSDDFAANARKCMECKFFRNAPDKGEIPHDQSDVSDDKPCMHLGSTPGDIECPVFKPIPEQGVAH